MLLVLSKYDFVLILVLPVSYKILLELECSNRYILFLLQDIESAP